MNQQEMKQRTKEYAKRILKLCSSLKETNEERRIADQLFRCGTSVGANYRAACRGRSRAEFISKINIALEEADESLFWLEIIKESKLIESERMTPIMNEASELIAIFVSTLKTAKLAK